MTTATPIHSDTTVAEILERDPAAVATLNGLGIDTCCGCGCALGYAAERAGVPVLVVLGALGAPSGGAELPAHERR